MTPTARTNNLVIQRLNNEVLVYDLQTNKIACLNETSALIWDFCNGKNSIEQITELVSIKLRTPIDPDLVILAVEQLNKNHLIENKAEFKSILNGFTRREVIRKIALTSMIALPMISIVVAPVAAVAQSGNCLAILDLCNQNFPSQCCSGLCGNVGGGGITTCCIDINDNCNNPNECCTAACNNGTCGV